MQDNVVPREKWVFDSDVSKCFDDMLNRSIPDYSNMRELCFKVGKRFVCDEGIIIDIGASLGNAIAPFVNTGRKCVAIEVSDPMRTEMHKRIGHFSNVEILNTSAVNWIEYEKCCLVMSILTLQFIPINYRQKIISNIFKSLKKGGAFILVEKVLGSTSDINDVLVDVYHEHKELVGNYSKEQIKRKAMSLEGVLVPVTSDWNVQMLNSAGFSNVDCFWRSINFAGWLAIK